MSAPTDNGPGGETDHAVAKEDMLPLDGKPSDIFGPFTLKCRIVGHFFFFGFFLDLLIFKPFCSSSVALFSAHIVAL